MKRKVDFLVIGSGIAGLSFALKVADKGKVCIVTKDKLAETATKYAQGGIAAVMYSPDTYNKHIQDTLTAGVDLNNEEIVRMTITESTDRIKELIEWGTHFDKTAAGKYELGKEGGHSENRVLHHKDSTGEEIIRALSIKVIEHPNIDILEEYFAIDIITQHHLGEKIERTSKNIKCFGAYIKPNHSSEIFTILSKVTLLASGGAGNVYHTTTNPSIATGDGIAMAYRSKAVIENMEFIQFHPTSLYNPDEKPSFLITEALRGFGAVLRNHKHEKFMNNYDSRGSLAPRDIVAQAIDHEMKLSGDEYMLLDCRHIDKNELIKHFPRIYAKCLSIGIDISKEMIPVVPAAHYLTGGVKVNEWGESSVKHLFVTGESSSTGLHGANRLASNSLLEAAVFSHRAAMKSIEIFKDIPYNEDIPDWDASGTLLNEEMILITQSTKELQMIMSSYVGIVRSNLMLQRALTRLQIIYQETEDLYNRSVISNEICELRNLINVAYLIIKMAQQRKESRGLHYSTDYPLKADKKLNSRK